jgi:hypothetical protein
MTAFARYGGYQHDNWEMNLARYTVRTRLSPRGKMVSRIYRMELEGEIQSTTGPAGITTKLNAILAAYHVQNQDALFYVDGVLTPHILPQSNSVSGVKVLGISHDHGDGTEYANRRRVNIVIQSEKEEVESQLYDWQETVRWIGTTGPRYEWVQGFRRPRRQRVCLRTPMMLVQSGFSVGWAGYVEPPGPLYPLIEMEERRVIDPGTPKSLGNGLRLFPTRWSYTHITDTQTQGFPNIR